MDKLVPSVTRYIEGFKKIRPKINNKQLQMLKNHYAAPAHALTSTALGKSVGFRDYKGANRWYGELATKLADAMNFDWRPEGVVAVSTLVLFVDPGTVSNSQWLWVLRPEVAAALEDLGWVDKTSHLFFPPGVEAIPPELSQD